ncbi:MAG: hypothetical protein E7633_05250 [Ruminococcaceae bacterium]|nr:hypothetical protein [Oscillospiraceae bacterium]
MNNEDKNERDIGGLGSNDAPPSPFVSKKDELLEKLRPHSYAETVAKPEIPRRGERLETAEEERPQKNIRSASVISQMRENVRAMDSAEKGSTVTGTGDPSRALINAEPEEEQETAVQPEQYDDKPRDDGYDIRTVFGIPEAEDSDEEHDTEDEETITENDFDAKKEFAALKKEFFSCVPKIIFCLILAAGTFIFENFELLRINNPVFVRISSNVLVSALAGLQMTIFAIVIMFREMKYGFVSLIRFKAQPESFLTFFAIFLVFYQLISFFGGYNEFVPFNFVLFFVSLMCLFAKWLDLTRKLHTLKIVSSKSAKYSLIRMRKTESAPEREAISGIMDLSEDAKYIRVVRSKKVVNYKKRTSDRVMYKRLSGVFIVAILIAVAVTLIVTKNEDDFVQSFRTAFSVVMLVTPFSLYTVFSLPLYKVSKRASRSGTAIVGEAATMEYCAPAFVTFNDTDIFTEKNVWLDEVSMKDSESFSKGLAYASVVFEPISGPLNKVLSGAADYDVTNEDVEYVDISDDGLEAVVNRERVRIGQASYFVKYGYMLEDESNRNYRIMYVEIGNVIALKIRLVYSIDKDFEKILQNLYKSGMGIVIRTSDPNINISMLESIIGTGRFPIKILKYRTEKEMDVVRETADSGIITKGKTRPLLETLYRCDRAGAVIKSGLLLEAVAFVVGVIAALLLSTLDALGGITSLHIAIYHFFWSALVWLLTTFFV